MMSLRFQTSLACVEVLFYAVESLINQGRCGMTVEEIHQKSSSTISSRESAIIPQKHNLRLEKAKKS